MSFTIEFDDTKLREKIRNPYKNIAEQWHLGMSFAEFISLGDNIRESNHVYLRLLEDDLSDRISRDSYFYVRLKEFVDLCIKVPSLYNLETLMFFLHIMGLSIPQNRLEYQFNANEQIENLIRKSADMSSFEVAIRCFAASSKNKSVTFNVYTCETVEDICIASMYHILKLGLPFKKCANCGKYFIPYNRSDTIYCDRVSENGKTCKEYGAQKAFQDKLKYNDAERLRRSIYMAKQMRVRRNPNKASYKESFETWKGEVAKWKKALKRGTKTSEEFIEWLNDSKKS